MQPDKIMSADLLDILFEGKNKAYGAYELRRSYNRRITLSVTGMAVCCLLFFLSRLLANNNGNERAKIPMTDVSLKDIKEPEDKHIEPPQVKPPKTEPPRVATTIYTPPVIVADDKANAPPPDMDKLADTKIGLVNQDGAIDDGFAAPPVEQITTGNGEGPKTEVRDIDKPFTRVEKEAKFPGGLTAWKRYLERNLNANVAASDGAALGSYTVKVQFIVDRQGGISNVQAVEVPTSCPDCGAEAVKVIKNGPNWEPAVQNGTKVTYQAVQLITFTVAGEQ